MLAMIFTNTCIFSLFANAGMVNADDVGGTTRYVEARQNQVNHHYVIVRGPEHLFFDWDTPISLAVRLTPYLGADQTADDYSPDDLKVIQLKPPFTLFMNGELYKQNQELLTRKYPRAVLHKIAGSPELVALEEPTSAAAGARSIRDWDVCLKFISGDLGAGNYDAVRARAQEALHSPEALSKGSAFKSRLLFDLGLAEMKSRHFDAAEADLIESYRLWEKRVGVPIIETYKFPKTLGDLQAHQNHWSKAERWYRKSLAVVEEAQARDFLLADRPEPDEAYRNIARSLWCAGKVKDADQILKRFSNPEAEKTKMLDDIAHFNDELP